MRTFQQLILFTLAWLGTTGHMTAQSYVLSNDIPVQLNGNNLDAAWAGGLNSPQFSTMDLNQDGNMDLVVFDRFDDALLTFVNQGTPFQTRYVYAPEYQNLFPSDLAVWMLLRDYNGDGYMDIFTSVPFASNIRVFRNNAPNNGGNHEFILEEDTLTTIYPPSRKLYVPRSDIPSIEDMDGDGDLDILSFDVGGSFVEFHRNTSFENNGHLNDLSFEVQSRCYGHFRESGQGCSLQLGLPPCLPGNNPPPRTGSDNEVQGARHSGSTLLAMELNGDDNLDLLLGDISCNFVSALYGSDTSQVAHFDSTHNDFPTYDTPVDIPIFPAMFNLDVDNDGTKDLLMAPNQSGNVEDKAGVWYFRNVGSDSFPQFQLEKVGFLQSEMIETGTGTVPVFFDHNSDGLQDILIGNIGRYDTMGGYQTSLWLLENTGTPTAPGYEVVDRDYLSISTQPGFNDVNYLAPTFGDLDGDGDQDLLMGDESGALHYFTNTPNPNGTANFFFQTSTFGNINADIFTHPDLHDLDNDGDLDLLIGNIRGDIHYYENTGSASNPVFTFITDSFGGIEITDLTGQSFTNGFARPQVMDYDFDGVLEVLVGSIEGPVEVFEDFSLAPGAVFTPIGALFGTDFGKYSSLSAAQLDSSVAYTYIFGSGRGGLQMMTYTGVVSILPPTEEPPAEWRLFPNPTASTFRLELVHGPAKGGHALHIFDAVGRQVMQRNFSGLGVTVDVNGLAGGVYAVVVEGDGPAFARRLVVRK